MEEIADDFYGEIRRLAEEIKKKKEAEDGTGNKCNINGSF